MLMQTYYKEICYLQQKYGYLQHEWQESEQGPPRKYYSLTDNGKQLVDELKDRIKLLNNSLKNLEKGAKR